MIFARSIFFFTICSISIHNYSMNQVVKEQKNKDLTREIVIRRSYNSFSRKEIKHSLIIDFSRYIYAFLKDDNTLLFNVQNHVILEKNSHRARAVFKILTRRVKPKDIKFSDETHTTFEKIKLSNKSLSYGAQIISFSQLKCLINNSHNKDFHTYNDFIFNARQFYMRPFPLLDYNNNKEKEAIFKRVKLFEIKNKITITQ